jgi:hypothetical protein
MSRNSKMESRADLQNYVGELRALGSYTCGLTESLRFIRERVQSLYVAPERSRAGHLYACSLSQAGYAGRKYAFVVGLEEGRIFSSSTEDAVLLDAERMSISSHLRLSTDRIDEAVYAILSRLASSAAQTTFSYSSRDTREFRETYASWIVLRAFRLQRGDDSLSFHAMKEALGEPKSAVPRERETALSSSGWWLTSVVGTQDEGMEIVGSAFPGIANGQTAEGRRQAAEFTKFDGYVPDAGPALDPSASAIGYSVTCRGHFTPDSRPH